MMQIFVFTGPTITPAEAREYLDAVYLPPVSQGDVYRAALTRPRSIGIIDGYFERVPAVWHKEILWAMEQGIHVYGSASMGALRAAELYPFGMVGVGRIFEWYRDGYLEDDDEVTLVHGSGEVGFAPISEPMVNIRVTLEKAERDGIVDSTMRTKLEDIAKSTFYKYRTFSHILRKALDNYDLALQVDALRKWLPENRVNQKKLDAIAMLSRMARDLSTLESPLIPSYRTQCTEWWQVTQDKFGAFPIDETIDATLIEMFLDELRLDLTSFVDLQRNALLRLLANREAQREGWLPNVDLIQNAADSFRRRGGLTEADEIQQWLRTNHLNVEEFTRLMRENVLLGIIGAKLGAGLERAVVDEVRLSGRYHEYLSRAQRKRAVLEQSGVLNREKGPNDETHEDALRWFFDQHLVDLPHDIEAFAQRLGYEESYIFQRAVFREYVFQALDRGDET